MAHRYLYYVVNKPIITDEEYDRLEKKAEYIAPPDHGIHRPGSESPYDYTAEQIALAIEMNGDHE